MYDVRRSLTLFIHIWSDINSHFYSSLILFLKEWGNNWGEWLCMRSVWICVHGLMTTCVIIFRGGPRGFKILEVIQYLLSPFHSLTPPRFDLIMLGRLNPSARLYLPRLSRKVFHCRILCSGKWQSPTTNNSYTGRSGHERHVLYVDALPEMPSYTNKAWTTSCSNTSKKVHS